MPVCNPKSTASPPYPPPQSIPAALCYHVREKRVGAGLLVALEELGDVDDVLLAQPQLLLQEVAVPVDAALQRAGTLICLPKPHTWTPVDPIAAHAPCEPHASRGAPQIHPWLQNPHAPARACCHSSAPHLPGCHRCSSARCPTSLHGDGSAAVRDAAGTRCHRGALAHRLTHELCGFPMALPLLLLEELVAGGGAGQQEPETLWG